MLDHLKIGTKIGAGFTLGLAIFAAIGGIAYRGTNHLIEASRLEKHTYEVLGELKNVLSLVQDAETGQRGYIITGEKRYLEPYETANKAVGEKLTNIRRLTQDNPVQQASLNALEPAIATRLGILRETLEVRQRQGLERAISAIRSNRGKNAMDNIRRMVAAMEDRERQLLEQRTLVARSAAQNTLNSITYGIPISLGLLVLLGALLARSIAKPIKKISDLTEIVAGGDLDINLPKSDRTDEVGILTRNFNKMVTNLRETTLRNQEQTWLKSNIAELSQRMQGQREFESVARSLLSQLVPLVNAQQGAFYVAETLNAKPILHLRGSYAYQERKHLGHQFQLGEGLVGQCALEKQRILLTEVPSDYIRIGSGLGEATPLNIVVLPIVFEQQVLAVLELASFQRFTNVHLRLLDQVSETIGAVLVAIAASLRQQELLEESQTLAEELQAQQEELEESNEQLHAQAKALQISEQLLRQQREELKQSNDELQQLNEELEEKAESLEAQKRKVELKNDEIEQARTSLQEKAEQLALSSKYKSEFLANMSHELRTPLNSLLILARLLSDNTEGTLTDKQVEYSKTIHSSGNDLLILINDILDLAKIESGTLSIDIETVSFTELRGSLERAFRQIANEKGVSFAITLDDSLPDAIATDSKRLQQVLKNLLSNAFKFTDHGHVTLRISSTQRSTEQSSDMGNATISFAVSDTGIGIAADKQKIVFEAFQQADGTTSRRYGGTGLGLSISREIAYLLGGELRLVSQPGQGSTFTLSLPQLYRGGEVSHPSAEGQSPRALPSEPISSGYLIRRETPSNRSDASEPMSQTVQRPYSPDIADDRGAIQPGDRTLLIIEDDVKFAKILLEMAREQGFKGLVALRSQTGLALAQQFQPHAIMLDIHLPDGDGWMVLDRLKRDPNSRHIPIHILSSDDQRQRGLQSGAIAYLVKPISPEALSQVLIDIKHFIERQVRNLLIVEDDPVQAQSIVELIGNGDVKSITVYTGAEALEALKTDTFDCVVMDLGLPDINGIDLIEQIKQESGLADLPIIIYTGKELTRQEETHLKRLAETIIVKDVRSPERLLDETSIFLHRMQSNLPQPKRQMLESLRQADPILANKKVLIVDDDVRNIFALTSLLEGYQMQVEYAENGRDGLDVLQANPDIDIVLMDIMMPEMDGYETTCAIRQQNSMRSLPIIALTAKAMQGDREKCIEAGASDYITKPVDSEQLISLLRVWLYR
ncbi:response regulator [Myxacorys almedinensis]|uniref:Circadian input-output histidine kinase CikA n=1 Tax=Myxacorys almedinensis A TaxID=2690445 RepID=A0A8J8CJ75_9CYAN|nr:response regulator [Myxacorys almedinensis]NDJ17316.1 response regulator [Myxacorys almedinensis A]